ncbi:class I SAM-dependent methyltransferase [Membranihabitans marinus]|uniref:class I SAM-dependent methyltransferase n=1 Tax=Membranihabitans marinus TaxID=1227546 RepID=UPI001F2A6E6E|nr:class I SAM-dependent methyltransferase [Membranihabitans marinus]
MLLPLFLGCKGNPLESDQQQLSSEDSNQLYDHISFYESEQRHIWQKPNYVIELFGNNLENKVIADIGASTGYFTFHSLPKVKKMIAVDIDSTMVAYMKSKVTELPKDLQEKVDIRLTQPGTSALKPGEVDGALLVSTYPYIENKASFLSQIKTALKPDGKLIFIEFKNADFPNGPPDNERIEYQKLIQDLTDAGFSTQLDTSSLTYQYIVLGSIRQ